jgi:hypothetical protein
MGAAYRWLLAHLGAAYDWLLAHPEPAAALATILLTVFAFVQVCLEFARRRDRERSAAIEATGPAWLARRSMEAAMRFAAEVNEPFGWAEWTGGPRVQRIQGQVLRTLRLTSVAGGKHAKAGQRAFTAFVGFADRVNALAATHPRPGRDGYATETDADKAEGKKLFGEALDHLESAVAALAVIAPRRAEEGALPKRADVPLLAPNRRTQTEEGGTGSPL